MLVSQQVMETAQKISDAKRGAHQREAARLEGERRKEEERQERFGPVRSPHTERDLRFST